MSSAPQPQQMSEGRLQRQNQVLVELARRKSIHQGNFNAALQEITEAAAQTLAVERTSVWLYNSDRSHIHCLDLYECTQNRHSQGEKLWASLYPEYFLALEQERTIAAHNASTDLRTQEFSQAYLSPLGIAAMLDAPIWLGGQMVGVFCHEHVGHPRQWTLEEQQFAASIADLLSLAMEARDRQKAREELQASEERLQSFFNATFEGVAIHDQGRVVDVNHAAETLFGYTATELIGMMATELVSPDSHELVIQRVQRLSDLPFEVKALRKDGTTFIAEVTGKSILYQGRPARVVGVRDITERKQAEAELQRALQREQLLGEIAQRIRRSLDLKEILQTTVTEVRQFLQADRVLIGFIRLPDQRLSSPQGQIVAQSVGPNWLGCPQELIHNQAYLQSLVELFHSGQVSVVKDIAQIQSDSQRQALQDFQVQASLEVPIPLYAAPDSSQPQKLVNPESFGVLIAQQCSQTRQWQKIELELLKQLATQVAIAIQQGELYQQLTTLNANLEYQVQERTAQLQQKMQELQELNQLKDVFLHAVSHDLRTPVMGSLLVLNNLLHPPGQETEPVADSPLPDSVSVPRKVLERMIDSNNRQLSLINSLLETHASDVGGMVLHRAPMALAPLLAGITADLEPLLARNQASLALLVPADLPLVNVDVSQLRRVYENLITNALTHNPPGLHLTLNATVEGNELLCIVQDDGVGIEPEQAEHLFDLYYRGGNTRHLTGVGLGLYLCRQVVQAHGGEIGVISQPGAGASFWFTLPLVEVAP